MPKMSAQKPATEAIVISVEHLQETDLGEADRIFRLAFATFIGIPDPALFHKGADYIYTRWTTDSKAAFAAKTEGRLIGTNFGTNWGSVGFFGPLTIHPDYWDRGVGKRLMEPIIDLFGQWRTAHAGLFTFAQSQKHVGLYQKFGFSPRFLTAIMSLPVRQSESTTEWNRYSQLAESEQAECLQSCRALTNEIYEGLDIGREIRSLENQKLGDTVLLWEDSNLVGVAACHCGEGTEAGPDACYIKFGAARPGPKAATNFGRLLSACEALAAKRKLSRLLAGVNTARSEAYQQMLGSGFKTEMQGVAMHRPNDPGYCRAGAYVIDDWR